MSDRKLVLVLSILVMVGGMFCTAALTIAILHQANSTGFRAPFVMASLIAGGATVLLALVGAGVTLRVIDPLVRRLQQSDGRFRLDLDAVSDGEWDWNVVTGEIRYSSGWLESLGYKRDEVPPHISFSESIVHPDDMLHTKETLNAHLDGRAPYYQCENRFRTSSGEYRWNLDRGRVVARDDRGKPLRMVGTGTDITDRKQAETTLRESNERLAATADQLKSLMRTATEGKTPSVRFSNPSVVRCWEAKNCEHKVCPAYGHEGGPRCWEVAGTLCGGEVQGVFAQKLEDCRQCEVYQHAREDPIGDLGETFNEMIAILEARQRELERAAEAAEIATAAKSEFLANMSHEIRTPMTAILGFAENLFDPDHSQSERCAAVHTIHRNAENLLGLINDILDLSKIEAGKMEVERIACEPCRIIAEVVSLMRIRAKEKSLPFNIEYIGAIPETIRTDPTRVRQILLNLIGNAIKFTQDGAVRLVTRFVGDTDEPRLQFDVIDTGRGMTQEQVGGLFQPFAQADTSTARTFGGTGLGLTISRRFAELLGGDITVAATEMDAGTTLRATVTTGPLDGVTMLEDPLSATVVVDSRDAVAQVALPNLNGARILLAEDGLDNQRLISFVLKKAGANVTVEGNGKLAVEKALAALHRRREGDPECPFDIILMDMQMPVMDGYEATCLLRRQGFTGPIVALTANAMATDREKCLKAGCDDYSTKPIDRKKLIETIQQHLEPVSV